MTYAENPRRINPFRENMSHYLIGFVILAKGYAKLEHRHDRLLEIILIFLAGIFIILGAAFHRRIAKKIRNFTATFHVAEGIALLFIGVIFQKEGDSQVQYFYFFLGLVYLVIGLLLFFVREEKKQRVRRQIQLWIGIAFLAAGIVTFLINRINDGDAWANVVSLVFAVVGLIMVGRRIRKKESRILKV